ncbi:uncharacterized protein LOC100903100 [Galendromus occidentalis]|uniref:Uncharacterized protein LOC100903100 n=1 Tax=Galendromus occidentalis TaxID=34638 RepID=A0AAJ6QMF6_9ACAR|nr:uncharacterized protein LOC100903100 [Galendromus occidentalis]
MKKSILALLIGAVIAAAAQDAPGNGHSVIPKGANAEIKLWWNEYPCPESSPTYSLSICLDKRCTPAVTDQSNYTVKAGFGVPFPIAFWNEYTIGVAAECAGKSENVTFFRVETGPGDLLPLRKFSVASDSTEVRLSFTNPEGSSRDAAQAIRVKVCDLLNVADFCSIEESLPSPRTDFTSPLEPGVLYNVSAIRVRQENSTEYTSQALTDIFTTAFSIGKHYSPVENLTVSLEPESGISRNGIEENLVKVSVSYSRPSGIADRNFKGVFAELYDTYDGQRRGDFKSYGAPLSFPGVPLHRICNVTVYAVHGDGGRIVLSRPEELAFFSGAGDVAEASFTVDAEGPYAKIHVFWEKELCKEGEVRYKLTLCRGKSDCIEGTTQEMKYTFESTPEFPLILWTSYNVTIEGACGGGPFVRLQDFVADSGPGELLPLRSITVIPEGDAVNISYTKPDKRLQNVAHKVELQITDVLNGNFSAVENVPIEEDGFRFAHLEDGHVYTIAARLTKSLRAPVAALYTSQALTSLFTTALQVNNLPRVGSISIAVGPSDSVDTVEVTVTCTKPASRRLNVFKGFFVDLIDYTNAQKISSFTTNGTTLTLSGVPSYRIFNVTVRALYQVAGMLVQSPDRKSSFFSGIEDTSKFGFNLTSDGPTVNIGVFWQGVTCMESAASYQLTLCREDSNCITRLTDTTTYIFENDPRFPIVFWNVYNIIVEAACDGPFVKIQHLSADTGPGELLPLQKVTMTASADAMEISFVKPDEKIQNVAETLQLVVCDFYADTCSEMITLPIEKANYTLESPKTGVLYDFRTVLAKQFNGSTYRSGVASRMFVARYPDENEYPRVGNVTVEIEPSEVLDHVKATIRSLKPVDKAGRKFEGIFVELYDVEDDQYLEYRSSDSNVPEVIIPALPLHCTITATAHALYKQNGSSILSAGREVTFFSGSGDASRSGFDVIADGPLAAIELWWEEYVCKGTPPSYRVTACLGTVCVQHNTDRTEFEVTNGFSIPVIFWTSYKITIEGRCAGTWVKIQEFFANTGPGELLPLQYLSVVPGNNSTIVSYVFPNKASQEVADSVELIVCDVLANNCRQAENIPTKEISNTLTDLKLGVLYSVSARLVKKQADLKYSSLAIKRNFTSGPADEKLFPPVETPDVSMEPGPSENEILVNLTCLEPKRVGDKIFYGIFVELYDFVEKRMINTIATPGTKLRLPPLPRYRSFNATVHAVYKDGTDSVQSVGRRIHFFTHIGELKVPKPEIVKLASVTGTTAVVLWSQRTSTLTLPLLFKVTLKEVSSGKVSTEEVDNPESKGVVLRDLKPQTEYVVSLTAYIRAEQMYHQTSDEKKVITATKDALKPVLKLKSLEPDYKLQLTWDVLVPPEAAETCYFVAMICSDRKRCSDRKISDKNLRSTTFDTLPYTNYTAWVRSECRFEEGLFVTVESEFLQYTTNEVLAPVERIEYTALSETSVVVKWTVPKNQIYTDFNVQWTKIGGDGFVASTDLKALELNLDSLDRASGYKVQVKVVREYKGEVFHSEPTAISVYPKFPAPPQVTGLIAGQKPYRNTITARWSRIDSDHGTIRYKVKTVCLETNTWQTTAVEIEFSSSKIKEYKTECNVSVSSCLQDLREDLVCSQPVVETFSFFSLPKPTAVKTSFQKDGIYDVEVSYPSFVSHLENIGYQLANKAGLYSSTCRKKGTKSSIVDYRYDQRVTRKARLCINDLVGVESEFSFETNVGVPGMPSEPRVQVDLRTLKIEWSKPEDARGPINGYIVDISFGDSREPNEAITLRTSQNNLTVTVDEEYTRYKVAVRAYNLDKFDKKAERIGWNSVAYVKTLGKGPPPPENFEKTVIEGRSRIHWEEVKDPRFNVTWYKVLATSMTDLSQTELCDEKPLLDLSVLTPYTEYHVEVSSCVDGDLSPCGKPGKFMVTTDASNPGPPDVMLVEANATSMSIRWTIPKAANGPIDGYEFAYMVKASGGTPSEWSRTNSQDRFTELKDLAAGTEYLIHVRAFNLNALSDPMYSSVGVLTASTEGSSSAGILTGMLSVFGISLLCGLSYAGYILYRKRTSNSLLLNRGPQRDSCAALQEIDL